MLKTKNSFNKEGKMANINKEYGREHEREYGREYGRDRYGRAYGRERGLVDRAGDEVRSWFGDEHAQQRRRVDDRIYNQGSREQNFARGGYGVDEARASDVMTREVITVFRDDTVERAGRLMGECDCGSLPVINRDGRLIGMVTDRDIAVRIAGRGLDPRYARVDECMTDEVIACHVNDSIRDCMRTMSRHKIRRLPIIYDRERVIGIISQSDLARFAGFSQGHGERRAVADTLRAISEPTYSPRR
jgi:CBS domain-containing protein